MGMVSVTVPTNPVDVKIAEIRADAHWYDWADWTRRHSWEAQVAKSAIDIAGRAGAFDAMMNRPISGVLRASLEMSLNGIVQDCISTAILPPDFFGRWGIVPVQDGDMIDVQVRCLVHWPMPVMGALAGA